jgi:hypothetical protein
LLATWRLLATCKWLATYIYKTGGGRRRPIRSTRTHRRSITLGEPIGLYPHRAHRWVLSDVLNVWMEPLWRLRTRDYSVPRASSTKHVGVIDANVTTEEEVTSTHLAHHTSPRGVCGRYRPIGSSSVIDLWCVDRIGRMVVMYPASRRTGDRYGIRVTRFVGQAGSRYFMNQKPVPIHTLHTCLLPEASSAVFDLGKCGGHQQCTTVDQFYNSIRFSF